MIKVREYNTVEIDTLTQRDESRNPRRGSVEAIKESLEAHGQYAPLIVNNDTHEVLVGNHRLAAMLELGWTQVSVGFVDVTEAEADAIVIADNRTADLGSYDPEVLGTILAGLPTIEGTGFTDQDLALIVSAQRDDPVTTSLLMDTMSPPALQWQGSPSGIGSADESEGDGSDEAPNTSAAVTPPRRVDQTNDPSLIIDSLDQISSELEGVLALKESVKFPIANEWGIPELRDDYLLDSLPHVLDTWAGVKVTPDDGQTWWLYNYGVDSATGLPWDRTILSFYTYDHYFENWWKQPAHYTAKMLNAGIRMVVTPNYSLYLDDPPAIQLWNVYRSRWLGRYFQEAGLKVIPDVDGPSIKALDWTLLGVQHRTPVISHQMQTLDRDNVEDHVAAVEVLEEIINRVEPEEVLIYTGPIGQRLIEDQTWGAKIRVLGNRAMKRRGVTFGIADTE